MALRIRRYTGRASEAEALVAQAHRELGGGIELHRRTYRKARLFGLLGGTSMVEIVAMAEYHPRPDENPAGAAGMRVELTADEETPLALILGEEADGEEAAPGESPAAQSAGTSVPASQEAAPPAPAGQLSPDAGLKGETEAADKVAEDMAEGTEAAGLLAGPPERELGLESPAGQAAPPEVPPAGVAMPTRNQLLAGLQPVLQERLGRLLACGLSLDDACEVLRATTSLHPEEAEALGDGEWWRRVCRYTFDEILLDGGVDLRREEERPKVVVLVGPTGVGKTTTLAKIAAMLALQKELRVGLVSLDNYRIAAPEQLRAYAEIMGLSFNIVFTPEEYQRVVNRQRYQDVILVDTAGRSPLDRRYMDELLALLARNPPDEVHLVLSATMGALDIRAAVEKFRSLKFTHVDITKLDESPHPGGIFNITRQARKPLRYFTIGQRVPEDIREANPTFVRTYCDNGGRV